MMRRPGNMRPIAPAIWLEGPKESFYDGFLRYSVRAPHLTILFWLLRYMRVATTSPFSTSYLIAFTVPTHPSHQPRNACGELGSLTFYSPTTRRSTRSIALPNSTLAPCSPSAILAAFPAVPASLPSPLAVVYRGSGCGGGGFRRHVHGQDLLL